MDLSTGSLGWLRTRRWLDEEIERTPPEYVTEWHRGYVEGRRIALMNMRIRFNTPEEDADAERTRMEMFG